MGTVVTEATEALINSQLQEGEAPSTLVELSLHNHGLDRIGPALEACTKLRVLDLSFNRLCAIDSLHALADLRELRLYCNRISRLNGLASCTRLQVLQLHGNQLGDQPFGPAAGREDGLAKLSALHTLNLDRNPLSDGGLVALQLGANEQLTMLSLSHTRISSLAPLARLSRLEHLEANGNAIGSLEGSVAPGWATSLTELQLSANQIADLRPLRALKRLAVLHLNDNKLRSLRGFPALPSLVELQLAQNRLSSIQPLASAPTAAEAVGAQQGAARAGAASDKPAARPGVRPGARPTSRPDPRAGNGTAAAKQADATVAGADDGAPLASCPCPSLEVLDLAGNALEDSLALAEALASLPELAELRLQGNPCCDDGGALARALDGSGAAARLSRLDDVPLVEALQRLTDASAPTAGQPSADATSRQSASAAGADAGAQLDAARSGPGHEAAPLARPPSSRAEAAARGSMDALAEQEAALEQMRQRLRARLEQAKATVGTPRAVSLRGALERVAEGAAAGCAPSAPPASSASAPGSRVGSARPAPGGVRAQRPSADAVAATTPARAEPAPPRADAPTAAAARGAPPLARPAAASAPVRAGSAAVESSASGAGAAAAKPALARAGSKSRLDAARTFSRKCTPSAAPTAQAGATDAAGGARCASPALPAAVLSGAARSLAARDPRQAAQVLVLDEVVAGAAERSARFVLLPAAARGAEDAAAPQLAGARSGADGAIAAAQPERKLEPASVADAMGAEAMRAQAALARADRPPSRQLAPAASGAYSLFRVPVQREQAAPQTARGPSLGVQLARPGSASGIHASLRTPLRESLVQAQMGIPTPQARERASAAPGVTATSLSLGAARSRRLRAGEV